MDCRVVAYPTGWVSILATWVSSSEAQAIIRIFQLQICKHSCCLVQFSLVAQSCPFFATPWTAACQASLSITNSRTLLKFMSIELVMPSNHLILCHPLLLPSIFPTIRVFSKKSVLIRSPKYWSFSFSISPSNSGLISFRTDWLNILAVQESLKSLLQHHSSKHQLFTAQLSLWSNFHISTWLLEKSSLWLYGTCWYSFVSSF